jgi:GTP-binding protein EngB required for normal cell division
MTGSAAYDRSKPGQWLESIRALAKATGSEPEGLHYLAHLNDEHCPTTRIAVLGACNVGKSNLVNGLLGKRLLPVSALPSQRAFTIECTDGAQPERCTFGGADRPLSDLTSLAAADSTAPPVAIRVRDRWLAERQLSIAEKTALDVPDAELMGAIHRGLREVDIVVLAIDSLMPVRRSETIVLSECTRRGLPTIVALMKTDRLPPEERGAISEYVTKHVQAYARTSSVVEIAITSNETTGVEQLKEAIDHTLADTDFRTVRFRQTVEEFLSALEPISIAAQAALEIQKKAGEDRTAEHRRRQLAADEQAALWPAIENRLQARRQELDEKIRKGLDLKRQSIAELLMHDLEGRTDIKTWWQGELPFRLSRELRAAAESLSATANRQIAADLRWLQDQLTRTFRLPQAAIDVDTNVALDGGGLSTKDLALWDTNKMRIVTRVGQAAAVVMAGRLLFTAGLSGATNRIEHPGRAGRRTGNRFGGQEGSREGAHASR